MKKVISVILSLLIITTITTIGIPATATETTTSVPTYSAGDYTYTVTDGCAEITKYTGSKTGELTIPSLRGGYPVTSIGDGVFKNCSFTSVILPDTVTNIGNEAFYTCANLSEIKFPKNLKTIGDSAFHSCSELTEINLPESVTTIGKSAFYSCSEITKINLPTTLEAITDSTFYSCSNLVEINFPTSLKTIGNNAFYSCSKLTTVKFPSTLKTIGDFAFYNNDALTSVTIPEGVTTLGEKAFFGCYNCKVLNLPSTLTTLGADAFANENNLTTINISEENPAFCVISDTLLDKDCTKIIVRATISTKTFYIPETVKTIGSYAFYYWGYSSLYNNENLYGYSGDLPKGLTVIEDYAFCGTKQKSITLPESLTHIGKSAFAHSWHLQEVIIKGNNICFAEDVFKDCSHLFSVHIDSIEQWFGFKFTSIYSNPLCCNNYYNPDYINFTGILYVNGFAVTNITIPEGITEISDYCFYSYEKIQSIKFADTVKSIGKYAFYDCDGLSNVYIGKNITSIDDYAFLNCSLSKISIPSSVTNIGKYAIGYNYSLAYYKDSNTLACVTKNSTGYDYVIKNNLNYICFDEAWIDSTLYLEPDENWTSANTTPFVQFLDFKGNRIYVPMSDKDNDRIYEIVVPAGEWLWVKFLLLSGNSAEYNEDYVINQTSGFNLSTDYNCYTITTGKWSYLRLKGDADGKRGITINDVTYIQKVLARQELSENIEFADVDNDNRLSINDATYIQLYLARKIEKLPIF